MEDDERFMRMALDLAAHPDGAAEGVAQGGLDGLVQLTDRQDATFGLLLGLRL